jgi:RNA polymerase sigma factor (sigma-70 family)
MVHGSREDEFVTFYRQHYSLILASVERRLIGHSVAEDVTSEVFRVAWQHHARGGTLTLPWLYAVARNMVGNEYRLARRMKALDGRIRDEPPADSPDLDEVLELRRAIELLRPKDREALQLAYWDDLSGDDLAAVLGLRPSAARVRLLRARAALKRILDRQQVRSDG